MNAVVLLSGAGGGFHGPAGLYPSLASSLSSLPSLPVLTAQLDYSEPAYMPSSLRDVSEALSVLREQYEVDRVVLVGWSFGGGVAVGSAGADLQRRRRKAPNSPDDERGEVVGLVTVGTQTAGTDAIRTLHEGGLEALFIHGGQDTCLPPRCSQSLYEAFRGTGKELLVYPGDDHGCSQHRAHMLEKVSTWCVRVFTQRQRMEDLRKKEEETRLRQLQCQHCSTASNQRV